MSVLHGRPISFKFVFELFSIGFLFTHRLEPSALNLELLSVSPYLQEDKVNTPPSALISLSVHVDGFTLHFVCLW